MGVSDAWVVPGELIERKKREWVWLNGEEKLEEEKNVELALLFGLPLETDNTAL